MLERLRRLAHPNPSASHTSDPRNKRLNVVVVFQVTPVVVSKALELFMIALCDKASDQARQRNSKRITAGHLKQAIVHEDQFDFLFDIIEKIPDIPVASEPSSFPNGGDNSEDCAGASAAAPVKKTRKPRQRKPKDEDSF
jgi:hypothetical protein